MDNLDREDLLVLCVQCMTQLVAADMQGSKTHHFFTGHGDQREIDVNILSNYMQDILSEAEDLTNFLVECTKEEAAKEAKEDVDTHPDTGVEAGIEAGTVVDPLLEIRRID